MRQLSLVCAAAALAVTVAGNASDPAPRLTQAEAETAVRAVLPDLEEIRGLKFTRAVPVSVIDDAKAREYALARFKKLTPEAKIRADQTVFRLLGLVPKDLDVVKSLLDVLEEQAGGFYDPTTKSFYLLDDMPRDMTALLTAHEMTHALEDQRYDIDGRIGKVLDDDDASFALSAVVEGSATMASAVYVSQKVSTGALDPARVAAVGETVKTERLDAMPDSLRRQLLGPYVLGMTFLTHRSGLAEGFPTADLAAAWANMPRSSEQILHPEKYWEPARRDEPKRVVIASPKTLLGKGWSCAGSGVLGELLLGSLVGAKAPENAELESGAGKWTNPAAAGWGGDRFELWTKGSEAVVLLATVWDTAKDAVEFEAALVKLHPELPVRKQGTRVAILAGVSGERRSSLLTLLATP